MNSIVQQFSEKIYSLMGNYLCEGIFERGLSVFTEDLMKELAKLKNKYCLLVKNVINYTPIEQYISIRLGRRF